MITDIYINGLSGYKGKKPNELPELTESIFSIGLIFDSFQHRDVFCKKFAKSMKLKATALYDYINGKPVEYPYVECRRMAVNNVTGLLNELGDKRMLKFHQTVKAEIG